MAECTFHAIMHSAEELPEVQTFRAQDPYVKVIILPSGENRQSLPSVGGGQNPEWDLSHDNDLSFRVAPSKKLSLVVEIWNANTFVDDLIAKTKETQVPAEVYKGKSYSIFLPMEDDNGCINCTFVMEMPGKRSDYVELKRSSEALAGKQEKVPKTLHIEVYRACNLPDVNLVNKQSPYLFVKLKVNGSSQKKRTKCVLKGHTDPIWNQTHQNHLTFELGPDEELEELLLQVWNECMMIDELISHTTFKGEEVSAIEEEDTADTQWIQMTAGGKKDDDEDDSVGGSKGSLTGGRPMDLDSDAAIFEDRERLNEAAVDDDSDDGLFDDEIGSPRKTTTKGANKGALNALECKIYWDLGLETTSAEQLLAARQAFKDDEIQTQRRESKHERRKSKQQGRSGARRESKGGSTGGRRESKGGSSRRESRRGSKKSSARNGNGSSGGGSGGGRSPDPDALGSIDEGGMHGGDATLGRGEDDADSDDSLDSGDGDGGDGARRAEEEARRREEEDRQRRKRERRESKASKSKSKSRPKAKAKGKGKKDAARGEGERDSGSGEGGSGEGGSGEGGSGGGEPERYLAYTKMLKLGLPLGAVLQKMNSNEEGDAAIAEFEAIVNGSGGGGGGGGRKGSPSSRAKHGAPPLPRGSLQPPLPPEDDEAPPPNSLQEQLIAMHAAKEKGGGGGGEPMGQGGRVRGGEGGEQKMERRRSKRRNLDGRSRREERQRGGRGRRGSLLERDDRRRRRTKRRSRGRSRGRRLKRQRGENGKRARGQRWRR
jgi:hypothetical protein